MTTNTEPASSDVLASDEIVCPFCGDKATITFGDIEGWIAYLYCVGCDMQGPMSEYKYADQDEAKADALNRWSNGIAALTAQAKAQEPAPVSGDVRALVERLLDPRYDGAFAMRVDAAAMLERLSAQEQRPAPASQEALVEIVARKLYACEKERSDRCDAIISAAKGKVISVGMEPWEECWQSFHDDARAVLAALSPHLSSATVERETLGSDIRIAIWNAAMKGGMGQDAAQDFIRRAMTEPTILRAIARGDHFSTTGEAHG